MFRQVFETLSCISWRLWPSHQVCKKLSLSVSCREVNATLDTNISNPSQDSKSTSATSPLLVFGFYTIQVPLHHHLLSPSVLVSQSLSFGGQFKGTFCCACDIQYCWLNYEKIMVYPSCDYSAKKTILSPAFFLLRGLPQYSRYYSPTMYKNKKKTLPSSSLRFLKRGFTLSDTAAMNLFTRGPRKCNTTAY